MRGMLKSYTLKIFANKGKREKLNNLLNFWNVEVNKKITVFWTFNKVIGSFCPTDYALVCGFIDKANRVGESFCCKQCDYINHADIVGAINLSLRGRVAGYISVPYQGGMSSTVAVETVSSLV